jgi:hypothetical protein
MLCAQERLVSSAVRLRLDRARRPKQRDKPVYGGHPNLEASGELFPGSFVGLPRLNDASAKLYWKRRRHARI